MTVEDGLRGDALYSDPFAYVDYGSGSLLRGDDWRGLRKLRCCCVMVGLDVLGLQRG